MLIPRIIYSQQTAAVISQMPLSIAIYSIIKIVTALFEQRDTCTEIHTDTKLHESIVFTDLAQMCLQNKVKVNVRLWI